MMANLIVDSLKELKNPKVIFFSKDLRFEGVVLAVDDTYIKFHDPVRYYTKFIKIEEITELEVKDE